VASDRRGVIVTFSDSQSSSSCPCATSTISLRRTRLAVELTGIWPVERPKGPAGKRPNMTHQNRPNRLGEIGLRYGSISVRTFREFYGSFAPHCADNEKLGEVLQDLDEASLSQLVRDFKSGKLAKVCQDIV
jgi:hypothetical protein